MKKILLVAASLLAACSSQTANHDNDGVLPEQGAVQATAQDSRSENPNPEMSPAMVQTTMVLNQLHHINQNEIAMAKLAKSKAKGAATSAMADEIISDHQILDQRLETVANQAGVELGAYQPATYEAAVMDSLKELNGKDFDEAFLQNMKLSHETASQELRRERKLVDDPAVQTAIDDALPAIQKHRQVAQGKSNTNRL